MRIFKTQGTFRYYNPIIHKMVETENSIPFVVNWNAVLIDEVNQYLLFKTELDWSNRSETPMNNAQNIVSYLEFCETYSVDFKNCSGSDIKKYIAFLTKKEQKGSTINNKISSLSSMYDWLYKNSILKTNPFLEFKIKETKTIINVFSSKTKERTFNIKSVKDSILKDNFDLDLPTQEELKLLYNELDKETKLMMLTLLSTGMRKEELLQLTIDMITNCKSSASGKTYSILLDAGKINIKNNKSRTIIISDSLRIQLLKHTRTEYYKSLINKYLNQNKNIEYKDCPIFISRRGYRFSTDKLNKSFDKACKKLNIKVTPHELRHFYASNFIYQKELKGTCTEQDYMYLAERLGHSSVETTKAFYVKIVNRLKQQEDIEQYSEMYANEFLGGSF